MLRYSYPGGSHAWDRAWELFCLGVSLLGLYIRVMTIGYRPHGTSGRNTHGQVAETLNTEGMYSITRHPLYLGNYFNWLGLALFTHDWWLPVIVSLAFWLYYERIMFAEESFLEEKFGGSGLELSQPLSNLIFRERPFELIDELPVAQRENVRNRRGGYFATALPRIRRPAFASMVTTPKVARRPLPSRPDSPGKMALPCNPVGTVSK